VTKNFYSGPPTGGELVLLIDEDWTNGQSFEISCRIHQSGTGADTRLENLVFDVAANRLTCAVQICSLLQAQFASHPDRPLNVTYQVVNVGGNAEIHLGVMGGTVDSGNLDIVLK